MKKLNVKIHYLYNSGFSLETQNNFFIFDYCKDTARSKEKCISNGVVGEKDLKINKIVFVLSSHSHADHFNPVILKWQKIRSDIMYILSSDIKVKDGSENIITMYPYEEVKLNDVYIKTFGSTDIGVSFLLDVDGISIFHSGDWGKWKMGRLRLFAFL